MTADVIYLDNHATTRVDPRVVERMAPYWSQDYGNAGSINHAFGQRALDAVNLSRERIAASIGATPREIVFTSGATESNNLALRGLADRQRKRGQHVVSLVTEHRAVLDPLERLSRRGFEVTLLSVRPYDDPRAGELLIEQLDSALRDDTLAVSVMAANNEIGVVQPMADIARLCHERGILVHCDATQAVGKLPVDVGALGVDLMSFTSHKLYGPKGVGALYVRRREGGVRLVPQIDGGGQEFGLRSGTLNVPGIVGFAAALELCLEELPTESVRLRGMRDRLARRLLTELDGVALNGPSLQLTDLRLAHNLNLRFEGIDGETLMMNIDGLAVSSGAACSSANPEPSHVLRALGLGDDLTRASLRFGLGRFTTPEEVELAADRLMTTCRRLRQLASR